MTTTTKRYWSNNSSKPPMNLKGLPPKEAELWERYITLEEENVKRMTFRGTLTPIEEANKNSNHKSLDVTLKALCKF